MAGNYPDVPSWRMAYDRDGTIFVTTDENGQNPSIRTDAEKLSENKETAAGTVAFGGGGGMFATFIFPERRDLDAYFIQWDSTQAWHPAEMQVSKDTTSGADGTWTTIVNAWTNGNLSTGRRTAINSITALDIKAVRFKAKSDYFNGSLTLRGVHLYGELVPVAGVQKLEIWDPYLDQKADKAFFDWGNIMRGSSATKEFRIKNLSDTYTAQSVRVAMEVQTDASPSTLAMFTMDIGAGGLAQVNVGDLLPGATSQIITMRRSVPETQPLGLWTFRHFAEAASWA